MKLYWTGDVGWIDYDTGEGITISSVKAALEAANGQPVEVELTTMGGNFFEAAPILNLLKNYKGQKTAFLNGIVASAGTVIAVGFDKVVARTTSMFMIHNAQSVAFGDHNDMREAADLNERMSDTVANEYAARTGKGLKQVKKWMDDETWFMGKEIVDAGFADEMQTDTQQKGTAMMLITAQHQFKERVTMWAKAKPDIADKAPMDEVESLIESGCFDKSAPVPTDSELSVKKYPIAKNGKVFRSSLRAISARAAKDDPELAKWATAMIAKIDAKGAIKVNEEEIVAYLKDKPSVFQRVAEASGHGAMLATKETSAAVEMKTKLVAANVPDPLATIVQLRADLEAVETDRVTNIMDATFGPVKLANGKENTLRTYAGVKLAGVKAVDMAVKIEEFRKDTLALKLAGELMDANSEVNLLGFVEKKVENKSVATFDGVPMVTV